MKRHSLRCTLAAALGLASAAAAQTTVATDEKMGWGFQGQPLPQVVVTNATPPRTVQLLSDALAVEKMLPRRVQLIAELGSCQLDAALPALRNCLSDSEPAIRAQAAHSAGRIAAASRLAAPEVRADLLKMVGDPDPRVRRQVVSALASLDQNHEGVSPVLEAALNDADQGVMLAAVACAATPQDAQVLARRLARLPLAVQLQAASALGRLGAVQYSDALLPLLAGSVAQKSAALDALAAMKASAQLERILPLLEDEHPSVRRSATAAVAALADETPRRQVGLRMLKDADPTVRQAAATLLATCPDVSVIQPLVGQLADPYAPLHRAAREALLIRAPQDAQAAAIQAAATLLENPDPRRREDGSYILGQLGSNAALERHMALLDIPDPKAGADVKLLAQVARSLGQIGDRRAAGAVTTFALRDVNSVTDPKAKEPLNINDALNEALIAAGRLGAAGVMPTVTRVLDEDWNPMAPQPYAGMLEGACWAAGVLAQPEPHLVDRLLFVLQTAPVSATARAEAAKALGNLKAAAALEALTALSRTDGSPQVRWSAHWAAQRISGRSLPLEPPVNRWTADVSIQPLMRQ